MLEQCELEADEHAMAQATVGLSVATLATPGGVEDRVEVLSRQLHSVGPHFDDRRAAAFGGLLAPRAHWMHSRVQRQGRMVTHSKSTSLTISTTTHPYSNWRRNGGRT